MGLSMYDNQGRALGDPGSFLMYDSSGRIVALSDTGVLSNNHIFVGNAANIATDVAMGGDATIINTGAVTLATVNANVGTFGSATKSVTITANAKGLITAIAEQTVTPAASSITGGAALTKVDDTNVTLTLGGAPTTALLAGTSITAGWTGVLSAARGGTGVNNAGTITNATNTTITGGGTIALAGFTLTVPSTGTAALGTGTSGLVTMWSGTNTITNSSLTAAKISIPLFDYYADVNNGTTVETDLYSDTLTAGRLANNGEKIYAQYAGTLVGDATSTQRLKCYFGGTLIFDTGALSIGVTTTSWAMSLTLIRESSSIVRCSVTLNTSFASLNAYATYTKVTGLTLANTQILKITGTAAGVTGGSNQITASEGSVEFVGAA